MAKSIDDTYDWGGFDLGLMRQDESDSDQLKMDENIAYNKKTHDYDILNAVAGVSSSLSKLGGKAAGALSGGKAVLEGIPLFDVGSGILSGIATYKEKKENAEEAEKEQADAKELKKERANSPTNQAYGMSLRNSGI